MTTGTGGANEAKRGRSAVPALRFRQWLSEWSSYDFDEHLHRRRPEQHLYVLSMPAAQLRKICDVYKRERTVTEAEGIQRKRDTSRTSKIQQYVRYGYPFGELSAARRTPDTEALKKPGWLPTAIVVNILTAGDDRRGLKVKPQHLVTVQQDRDRWSLSVPDLSDFAEGDLAPIEVIDGQHRLWAFDEVEGGGPVPDDFELPVVAYHGLDVAWQAYLFWSINVSPKKINQSHAFDLYPLLRTQDWLETVGELNVYRQARAQELTEIMYSHPKSPWRNRINMLGDRGAGRVTQAGWVRSMMSTFFATGRGNSRPGLFQSALIGTDDPLEWGREQQAAFIIVLWNEIQRSITKKAKSFPWIRAYKDPDKALHDRTSLLNQDQGLRAVLAIANDIFFARAREWKLVDWKPLAPDLEEVDEEAATAALNSLERQFFHAYVSELANELTAFDWRSSEGPGADLDDETRQLKRSYRGAGGYSGLRADVLKMIADSDSNTGRVAFSLLPSDS